MKKYIKYIIISFMMFFSFNNGVKAAMVRTCEYSGFLGGYKVAFNISENGVTAHVQTASSYEIPIYGVSTDGYDTSSYSCPKTLYLLTSNNDGSHFDQSNASLYLNKESCEDNKQSSRQSCQKMSFKKTTLVEGTAETPNGDNGGALGPEQGQWDPPGQGNSIFNGSCPSDSRIISLFGNFYSILKLAVPIALVIFGTLDFAKAVMASDEGKMKKAQSAFVRRLIAALSVLLVVSLVSLLTNVIPSESGIFDCVKEILK